MFLNRPLLVALLSGVLGLSGCGRESAESLLASAKAQMQKNDNKAAVIQLKNALLVNGSLAEARFLLGKILLGNGDLGGASIELDKARDLGYAHDELRALLARVLYLQGQVGKLQTEYGEVELAEPKAMADLQTTLASAYAVQNKQDEARLRIDKALKLDSGSLRVQLTHVRILAGKGGAAAALPALESVLATHTGSAEAWLLKGELLAYVGRSDEAVLAFRESIKLDKSSVEAHSGLLSLLSVMGDNEAITKALEDFKKNLPNHPQMRLFLASRAMATGDLKTARENVQILLKGAADDGRVQLLAGAIEFRRGALLQAESHLRKALQLMPNAKRVRVLLAQTYLRAGEAAKAFAVLQPALDDRDGDADVFAVAAEAKFQLGDAKQAEDYLQKAVKLNPQDTRSRTALAMVNIGKGRSEQGVEELRVISAADASATADLALISVLMRKGEPEKALLAIDALERKQPDKPQAPMLRGNIELRRNNLALARQAFEAALKADPVYYPAAARLAELDLADKKPELAIKRFEQMLKVDPRHVQAQMAIVGLRAQAGAAPAELADLLAATVKRNPEALAPRLALVRLQLERKESKQALAAAQEGVTALPADPEMQELLGQVQMAVGDSNQALAAFNRMAVLLPSSPVPFMRIAEAHLANKDRPAAVQNLKRALSAKPDYMPAHVALVKLEMAAGRTTEARVLIRALQQQFPGEALGHELDGDLEVQQRNWPKAAAAYRAALDKRGQTDLAIKLHRSLMTGGKNTEAAAFEGLWRKEHAKDSAFVFYLGDRAFVRADHEQALIYYQDVLRLQPDNPAANNNVAWLLKASKKPGALAFAEKANGLRPKQPAFMDTLAEIHADAGQLDKALAVQKQAVALAPEEPLYRLNLARYLVQAGQKSEARQELKKLAELGDEFGRQDEVKKLQAQL